MKCMIGGGGGRQGKVEGEGDGDEEEERGGERRERTLTCSLASPLKDIIGLWVFTYSVAS